MRIKATIVAYVFSVQYFENVTIVAYVGLRWLATIHVWLHHKNLNAWFSKSSTNRLLEGVSIYKAFDNLSSPANKCSPVG